MHHITSNQLYLHCIHTWRLNTHILHTYTKLQTRITHIVSLVYCKCKQTVDWIKPKKRLRRPRGPGPRRVGPSITPIPKPNPTHYPIILGEGFTPHLPLPTGSCQSLFELIILKQQSKDPFKNIDFWTTTTTTNTKYHYCPIQNHWFRCRGVTKIGFSEKVKNRDFATRSTYGQYGLNTSCQKTL